MQGSMERGVDEPHFSLVFPAYNPGATVERTWNEVNRFLSQRPGNWEIVFVLDGCTDDSASRLRALVGTANRRVQVIGYHPNRGKGYAVRQGLLAARGRYRIFTDIDLAYGMEEVMRVAEALNSGAPVAIASRTHPDSRMVIHPDLLPYIYRRNLQSHVFTTLVRWLLPLDLRDTQAGLKGMSARVAEHVIPKLSCNGFGLDCEFLTACMRMQIPVTEVPVTVRYDDAASTTGVRSTGRMVRELWRIRQMWKHPLPAFDASGPAILRRAA